MENDLRQNKLAKYEHIVEILEKTFSDAGWSVDHKKQIGNAQIDMIIENSHVSYALEMKIISEGRTDRLLPAWSQACLQARKAAGTKHQPFAVIAAPQIKSRAADQLVKFAEEYAPDCAIGIVDLQGFKMFRGPYLQGFDTERKSEYLRTKWNGQKQTNLFSDLNQWMLKVLVAPDIPDGFLSAPRNRYRNATELAESAQVSVMTAFRFVEQLKQAGYLNESTDRLDLVRKKDLFLQWRSSIPFTAKELPVKFLLRGNVTEELNYILKKGRRCLGLFAAAEALHIGFVKGVLPYVYVSKIDQEFLRRSDNIRPVEKNEKADIVFRQASFKESVFRGCVELNGVLVSDIIQIWLDVSSHPSRGAEQADLIERQILNKVY